MNPIEKAEQRAKEMRKIASRKRNRERYHSDTKFRQAAIKRATEHKRTHKPSAMQNWEWYANKVLKGENQK